MASIDTMLSASPCATNTLAVNLPFCAGCFGVGLPWKVATALSGKPSRAMSRAILPPKQKPIAPRRFLSTASRSVKSSIMSLQRAINMSWSASIWLIHSLAWAASVVSLPSPYTSMATAAKPASAKRSVTFCGCAAAPHHSGATKIAGAGLSWLADSGRQT